MEACLLTDFSKAAVDLLAVPFNLPRLGDDPHQSAGLPGYMKIDDDFRTSHCLNFEYMLRQIDEFRTYVVPTLLCEILA
ncbi:unnamed protein product [Soboliphyme baturini]|uniref:EIF3_N domain-containing protein n=1 Tax=Soboliphyme baturini TaxID=241478 RepID=A0A183II18_9BILA|nr:unnamed protein product [Soboliphyme baturini]